VLEQAIEIHHINADPPPALTRVEPYGDPGHGTSRSIRPSDAEHLQTVLNNLNDVDFSHENKLRQYFLMPEEDRLQLKIFSGIEA
jgi:hypothetical protein